MWIGDHASKIQSRTIEALALTWVPGPGFDHGPNSGSGPVPGESWEPWAGSGWVLEAPGPRLWALTPALACGLHQLPSVCFDQMQYIKFPDLLLFSSLVHAVIFAFWNVYFNASS